MDKSPNNDRLEMHKGDLYVKSRKPHLFASKSHVTNCLASRLRFICQLFLGYFFPRLGLQFSNLIEHNLYFASKFHEK